MFNGHFITSLPEDSFVNLHARSGHGGLQKRDGGKKQDLTPKNI
jgi:hypothetical protein